MTGTRAPVPTIKREHLRRTAESLRAAADELDRVDDEHASDSTDWILGALRAIGDATRAVTPFGEGLLFFGHEFVRLTQTSMAERLDLTSSAVSRRLAVTRSNVNMAAWWAEHQK